jgi:hypothetical protein
MGWIKYEKERIRRKSTEEHAKKSMKEKEKSVSISQKGKNGYASHSETMNVSE